VRRYHIDTTAVRDSMMRIVTMMTAFAVLAQWSAAYGQVITIDQGMLAGSRADGVERYLGVPFAAAPIGALRWQAPKPAPNWRGVRNATTTAPICLQDSVNNPLEPGFVAPQSEDCLYLNIFRPAGRARQRLPVMVWIHGGAFIMGAGGLPQHDGSALASRGAIVISINYRLGRFGTFAHPALAAEQAGHPIANYGLMDQIAALRWARRNALALGGDPRNVTVMGESAGASSVNFLMTSPMARGLFDKAISESGGASAGLMPLADAEAAGLRWATGKHAADVVALRALTAEAVLDAPVRMPAFPVIDGQIVLGSTREMFAADKVLRVPYLVGANDYEQSLMKWLPGAGQALLKTLGLRAEPLVALYRRPGESRDVAVARLWGENAMTLPARQRARLQAGRGQPTWLYRFGYVQTALRATMPGAGHADELPMVFGVPSPAATAAGGWKEADRAMAKQVGDYWVAFARTGNPNHAGAPLWPRYTAADDRVLEFGVDGVRAVAQPGKRLDLLEAAMAH
jgi:para-nitrobenzyl esterase